jgi:hypothetical protein
MSQLGNTALTTKQGAVQTIAGDELSDAFSSVKVERLLTNCNLIEAACCSGVCGVH